jgi:hypothetical protein
MSDRALNPPDMPPAQHVIAPISSTERGPSMACAGTHEASKRFMRAPHQDPLTFR